MKNELLKHKICGQVKVTISCKYLLAMLIDLCDDKGEFVMSAKVMHGMIGISTTAILKNMHRLKTMGYIKVIHRFTEDGGRASNKYVLNLSKLQL